MYEGCLNSDRPPNAGAPDENDESQTGNDAMAE